MKLMTIDVESNGLYGLPFLVAALVTEEGKSPQHRFFRCPIFGDVNPWVAENVLPVCSGIPETNKSDYEMGEDFYDFWKSQAPDYMLADVPYPVEAGFLRPIFARSEDRWFKGPFPLIDVHSVLRGNGWNSGSTSYVETHLAHRYKQLCREMAPHNPLFDAKISQAAYAHLMAGR